MVVRGSVTIYLGGDVEPKNLSVKLTFISESRKTSLRGLPTNTQLGGAVGYLAQPGLIRPSVSHSVCV